MLWSRSLTNLLFFSFSVLFIIILSEWTAGERLPPRVSACILLAGCLGLTGEGVARSLGTAGGGTTSTTCPARSRLTPRGSGREEGRGTVWVLSLGLSGITERLQTQTRRVTISVSVWELSSAEQSEKKFVRNHFTAASVGWLELHISLTFSRANIRAQVKYFYTKFFSNLQSDFNRS